MKNMTRLPRKQLISDFSLAMITTFVLLTSFWSIQPAAASGTPISLTVLGSPYQQNFDTLATTGTTNDLTITGWALTESGGGTRDNEQYGADNGGSNTGDTYSYGATGNTERALGGLQSGTLIPTIGACFTNNTGITITSLQIAYTGEQWRIGNTAAARDDRIDFQYSLDATSLTTGTWIDVNALDFTNLIKTAAAAGPLDGNSAANRTAIVNTISSLSIPNGATFFIRWTDFNASGADDGLAIDDFSLTPNPSTGVTRDLNISDVSQAEGDPPGTTTFTFVVTLTSPAGEAVTFDIATADGTAQDDNPATEDHDYVAQSLTGQSIPAGSTGPYNFSVTVNRDTVTELNETFFVNVTNISGAARGADTQGQGTIINDDVTLIPIHTIQGASHLSPLNGSVVVTSGIVTAVRSNGFYLQDPMPDADDATSEAIFVFTSSAPTVSVGAAVTVTGTVMEFRPGGDANNLTITELTSPIVTVTSSGNTLPAPTIIGIGGRIPPSMVIEDDAMGSVEAGGVFDPATDGIDFYESLEAMRVQVNNAVVVGPTSDFGEILVLSDDGANASVRTTRGGIVVRPTDFNPERIFLDDVLAPTPLAIVGDHLSTIVGVMDYSFGNFKLLVTASPTVIPGGLSQESTTVQTANQLAIATFNVENLDPGDSPAIFNSLASVIVNNLKSPDIIALEEVQDNNGPTNDSVVDATTTYNILIAAIQAAGGPLYQFRQINPVDDQDGGEPGGNIRVGFLFRTDRGLAFVDRPGGTSTAATTVVSGMNGPQLSFSPGRIDPTNSAFNNSRKPLVGEFTFNCHTLFVVANHFNSKGGDQPLFGRFQPPTLSSEVQRIQQAQIVNNFVDSILAEDMNAKIVVLGDLNDFYFSTPLQTLKGGVLHNLIESLPENERYSYIFEGNSQALDHILVSNSLFTTLPAFEYDVVHVNAEFVVRTSDHDPQVARFTLADITPPTITCPNNILVTGNSTGPDGTNVTYPAPTVNDNCLSEGEEEGKGVSTQEASLTVVCSPASGSFFPVGTTTVTCTATDAAGNTAPCSFTVTVVAPCKVMCPANVTVSNTTGQCSAVVNYPAPTTTGNCVTTATCSPASGSTFQVGTTTVTCSADDENGRPVTCTFTVTVNDTQLPTIQCPTSFTVVGTPGQPNTVVTYPPPTASDNCPGVTAVCNPPSGSSFPVGTTSVTCTATDASGNTATCSFTVTAFDICLQDDSNPATVVLVNSFTGQYRFCCGGTPYTGTGTVIKLGSTYTLTHNPPDRRVLVRFNGGNFPPSGTAALQSPPGTIRCTITDRDTRNNSCACP